MGTITRHEIKTHSKEWYDFRKKGIGGSEISTILRMNPYQTLARVYHEKIGSMPMQEIDSEPMFWGRRAEDLILDAWKYYDGTKDGYLENAKNGIVIRNYKKENCYAVNSDYPWLFASVDGLIEKGGVNFITGEELQKDAVLECKTISHWAADAWDLKIPIYYILQIHQYMLIYETDYAEIAMLQDGNNFRVEKVFRDERLIERIVEYSKRFWYDRVLPGREALAEWNILADNNEVIKAERYEAIWKGLEPDPDDTEAYKQFMSDRYIKERDEVKGGISDWLWCIQDQFYKQVEGKVKKIRLELKNNVLKKIVNEGTEYLTFNEEGYARYYRRGNNINKQLDIKIKTNFSDEEIEEQIKKMKPNYYK